MAGPPGIYYEKVYSKNSNCLLGAVMLFCLALSYGLIIWNRNEWIMLINLTIFERYVNKI